MIRLAIFASGSGTNAENICRYFRDHPEIKVGLVLTNRKDAGVTERVRPYGVRTELLQKVDFERENGVVPVLRETDIQYIILAGFLLKISPGLIRAFPDRIINLHPALLPKFGGKGMYGMRVHEAVIAAGETETGITIHLVNENYDEGRILFQSHCPVLPTDSPDILASRVHVLEYQHYPPVIENYIIQRMKNI